MTKEYIRGSRKPKVGDLFTENLTQKVVIITSVDRTHVTTRNTVDRGFKVYPRDMFWRLHARP